MKEIKDISQMPTVIHNVHESCYRCFHILDYVLIMVERGDNSETILEVAEFLKSLDEPK